MLVPIHEMYSFLDQFCDDDLLIYLFYPHGSKKLSNLTYLKEHPKDWFENILSIPMIMHDQEPLHFDLYNHTEPSDILLMLKKLRGGIYNVHQKYKQENNLVEILKNYNLEVFHGQYISDRWLLCHSEKKSLELSKYESIDAIGVYWWSHASIARDWYRYACIDQRLIYKGNSFIYDFNVYNRAWEGSREYRLKFAEMIIENTLLHCVSTTFNQNDNGRDYRDHVFKNPKFDVKMDLTILKPNQSQPGDSACYSYLDYQKCAIDVILETLFDDTRLHLTEKTLRPISCGKPFILVSTPGSLRYLQDYGFETFGDYIDESYDNISDPLDRLHAVIKLMKSISNLSLNKKKDLYQQLHMVAERNKKWFWSEEFAQKIVNEFKENYQKSYALCKNSQQGHKWLKQRKELAKMSDDYRRYLSSDNEFRSRHDVVRLLQTIKKYPT